MDIITQLALNKGSARRRRRGEFTAGIARGIDNTQATGYGFIQTMGDLFGSDTISEWAKDGVEEQLRQAAQNPAKVSSYRDIESFSDLGDYAASALGEQVPNLLAIGGGAGAGVIAKTALGKTVAKQLANASSRRAATAGAASSTFPLVTGETQLEFNQAGIEDNPLDVLLTGAGKTALELGPLAKLVNDITKTTKRAKTASDVFKQAGKTLAKQTGLEGITEGAQTTLDKFAVSQHTDEDVFSEDNLHEIFDSILKGGIVGGAMGGAGQFVSSVYNGDFEPQKPDIDTGTLQNSVDPNQPPAPSLDEENQFSANAFVKGRQEGYIQTEGEAVPDVIINDPEVQSVEITPELSDDPQLKNATLYYKDPIAIETLKQGSGFVQNYGTASKPEITPETAAYIIGIEPVDAEGNKGSAILVDSRNPEEKQKVIGAQLERVGENGDFNVLETEQIQQKINARQKVQAELQKLEQDATYKPNQEDIFNQLTGSRDELSQPQAISPIESEVQEGQSQEQNALIDALPELREIATKNPSAKVPYNGTEFTVNEVIDIAESLVDNRSEDVFTQLAKEDAEKKQAEQGTLDAELANAGVTVTAKKPARRLPDDSNVLDELINNSNPSANEFDDNIESSGFMGNDSEQATISNTQESVEDIEQGFENDETGSRTTETLGTGGQTQTVLKEDLTKQKEKYLSDDKIEVKGEWVPVEQYREKAVKDTRISLWEKDKKTGRNTKRPVKKQEGEFSYGPRETVYNKDGVTPQKDQQQHVNLVSLTTRMLDVVRNIDQGRRRNDGDTKSTSRSEASRYMNAAIEAINTLVDKRSMPNRTAQHIMNDPDTAVAKINGEYFSFPDLVSMVSFENRPALTATDKKSLRNIDNLLIREEQGNANPETIRELKRKRNAILKQNRKTQTEKELTQEEQRGFSEKPNNRALDSTLNLRSPVPEYKGMTARELKIEIDRHKALVAFEKSQEPQFRDQERIQELQDNLEELEYAAAAKDAPPSNSVFSQIAQAVTSKGSPNVTKETLNDKQPEIVGQERTLDSYPVKDPVTSNMTKAKKQPEIEKELTKIQGVNRTKSISRDESDFVRNIQQSLGNETPIYVMTASDVSHLKKSGIKIPFGRLERATKDIGDKKTIGQYIPMGDFAAIVVKDFSNANPTPAQKVQRMMTIAHELGHMLYNTRYNSLPVREKNRLKDAWGQSDNPNFEEWFSDQVAATAKDFVNGKTTKTKDRGIIAFAKELVDRLREIFNAATESLSQRFKTDAQFKRFMDRAIKEGFFRGKDQVGFGEHRNFGKEDFRKAGERAAKLRHNPVINRAIKELSGLVRTADHELRKLGPTGEQIANLFHNRATTSDRTEGISFDPVDVQYKSHSAFTRGEIVYYDGGYYEVTRSHTTTGQLDTVDLKSLPRYSRSATVGGLKGWFEARNQMTGFWKTSFTDLMPKDPDQWNDWLQENAIDNPSPEFQEFMEKFWRYANSRMGGKLGKINGQFMPRVYNIDAITNDPEAFKDILRKHLKFHKGQRTMTFSRGEFENILDSIVNSIISNNGVPLDELYMDEAFKNTRLDSKKHRNLKDIPDSELGDFLAPNVDRLAGYIEASVKRAELEMRTGGYDDIQALERSLLRQKNAGAHVDEEYLSNVQELAARQRALGNQQASTQYWNPNSRLDKLFDEIEQSQPDEARKVRHIIDGYMGRLGLDMAPETRKIQQYLMALQYYTTLSFAAISSITDLGNILIRAKTSNMTELLRNSKVIMQGFKDRNALQSAASALGVAQHDTIQTIFTENYGGNFTDPKVQKANDFFFKAIGLEWLTKTSRTMSMSMAKEFIRQHTVNPSTHSERYLSDLGLTPADAQAWVDAGQPMGFKMGDGRVDMNDPLNKVASAITQFVDESILMPNAAMRPTWGSNLGFFHQLIWQLKSFFWAFGHQVIEGTYRELKNRRAAGESIPAQVYMTALAAAPLMGLAAFGLEIKEFIKYGDPSRGASGDMSMAEYTVDLYDRAGGFGPFGLVLGMMQAEDFGRSGMVSLLGPTAEHLDILFSGFVNGNPSEGIERAIPYISQTNGKLLGYDISPF